MAYTKAQGKAVNKYIAKNYDQIIIRIPKGHREIYKAYAEKQGLSLNALIVKLLDENMAIDDFELTEDQLNYGLGSPEE